jgi:hypothetical protein
VTDINAHALTFSFDEHGTAPHRLVILDVTDKDWIERVAEAYRELRTEQRLPDPSPEMLPALNGVDVLDPARIQKLLIESQIAKRRGGNFDVLRSDLAEVLMGIIGADLGGYSYGYRSIRDRESAAQPGRGIDQIGIRLADKTLHLMVGEAKLSNERRTPPKVVDDNDDSLSKTHRKKMQNRAELSERIDQAFRFCTDPETAALFAAARMVLEAEHDCLVLHLTSVMVRPKSLASSTDFGSYADTPDQFSPGVVEFYIVAAEADDIEALVDQFALHAAQDESAA